MKKTVQTTSLLISFLLGGCGSSISSDAQKVADLQCRVKELQQKVMAGDTSSQKDVQEYMSEAAVLLQEMNSKYVSMEEKQEFQQALMKATADCD